MVDLAEMAKKEAIKFEVKKDGLQQRQSGDWMLRFTVAATDMDRIITDAPMGTRFICVLVEINDDETPVDHTAQDRDKWAALGHAKQAGIRCKEPSFWAFLSEEFAGPQVRNEEGAAALVRDICGVSSRSEFSKPGMQKQRILWNQLDHAYQAWKVREHA
jgi:hypothetical protein